MKINASDLAAWKYCPCDFYYSRVLKKPKPISENLVKGILVHSLYKKFFDQKLYAYPEEFQKFLTQGIGELVKKEQGRIEKLKMNPDVTKNFLVNSAQGLRKAFTDGNVSVPSSTETSLESEEFKARADAIYDKPGMPFIIGDVKIRLRDLAGVKLQLTAIALILESQGKKVETALAIDASNWREVEIFIDDELKEEAREIRQQIIKMHETKEKPPCTCGRCELRELSEQK